MVAQPMQRLVVRARQALGCNLRQLGAPGEKERRRWDPKTHPVSAPRLLASLFRLSAWRAGKDGAVRLGATLRFGVAM
jgi:hypothetical protein